MTISLLFFACILLTVSVIFISSLMGDIEKLEKLVAKYETRLRKPRKTIKK